MKDALELKDYREKFKRYYGLEFSKDYHIHHIDLNHSNNDIDNLMIVPKELHEVYHECLVNVQMLTEGKGTSRLFEFDVKPRCKTYRQYFELSKLCFQKSTKVYESARRNEYLVRLQTLSRRKNV